MPRVSEEHRAARREQILLAAIRCVAQDGFHRTTMAQVIAASGMSAGAVYGYFASKDDLIMAIADRAIGVVSDVFDELMVTDPLPTLPEAVGRLTDQIEAMAGRGDVDITRVAVAAWAEAVRDEAVRSLVALRLLAIRGRFEVLAGRLQDQGRLDPHVDPQHVAAAVFGSLPGFVLQRLVLGDVSASTYAAGLAAAGGLQAAGSAAPPPGPGLPRQVISNDS